MARVTLLYFSAVREAIGFGEEVRDLPEPVLTARDVIHWLASLGEGYAQAFANPEKLRCAIDQVMVSLDSPLHDASEIAYFPPVTGG